MIIRYPESGKTSSPLSGAGSAWGLRATNLADWTLARLANRRDVWGAYRCEEEIGREFVCPDGTKGKLGKQRTVKGMLTRTHLVRHFRACNRSEIIGLHAAGPNNLSVAGALDIDWHGPQSTSPKLNLAATLAWYERLVRLGFRPLLTDSNGVGGFHLRVLLASPVPADLLFRFLKDLTCDHRQFGLPVAPEQFPKQPDVRRCKKQLGNWLRVPGRHHSRPFWSRVWDGRTWLTDAEAVAFILSLAGDPPALVPDLPTPAPAPRRSGMVRRVGRGKGCATLATRIARYASRLPNLSEGQGRTRVAFKFAAWLVRDMSLADDVALQWLEQWDGGNSPPLGRTRLVEILADAHAYGRSPYGCGLHAEAPRDGHTTLKGTVEL